MPFLIDSVTMELNRRGFGLHMIIHPVMKVRRDDAGRIQVQFHWDGAGWAAGRGATRAYVQVLADNAPAIALYESMGFDTQHHVRYVDARTL